MPDRNHNKLGAILLEYSKLPEYSEMNIPAIDTRSLFGDYPINIAATRGLTGEISILLSSGADVNAKGEHGYTPLHNAIEQEHIEAIKILFKYGANVKIKNDDGYTPYQLADLLKEKK